jgi:hypothetical protein
MRILIHAVGVTILRVLLDYSCHTLYNKPIRFDRSGEIL